MFAPRTVRKVTCSRASQIGNLRHMSWKESLPVIGRLYRQRTSLREEVRRLQDALSETRADLARTGQSRDDLAAEVDMLDKELQQQAQYLIETNQHFKEVTLQRDELERLKDQLTIK